MPDRTHLNEAFIRTGVRPSYVYSGGTSARINDYLQTCTWKTGIYRRFQREYKLQTLHLSRGRIFVSKQYKHYLRQLKAETYEVTTHRTRFFLWAFNCHLHLINFTQIYIIRLPLREPNEKASDTSYWSIRFNSETIAGSADSIAVIQRSPR